MGHTHFGRYLSAVFPKCCRVAKEAPLESAATPIPSFYAVLLLCAVLGTSSNTPSIPHPLLSPARQRSVLPRVCASSSELPPNICNRLTA